MNRELMRVYDGGVYNRALSCYLIYARYFCSSNPPSNNNHTHVSDGERDRVVRVHIDSGDGQNAAHIDS